MKESTSVLFLGVVVFSIAVVYLAWSDNPLQGQPQEEGSLLQGGEHFMIHNNRQRRYVVHMPRRADGTKPLPVVLGFHGALGSAETFEKQSRLSQVADREGFLVVYPDGTGPPDRGLFWNAGPCGGYAADRNVDDVGFIRQLLDELPRRYRIDPNRVYAVGMSNGAMMCYRLAHELSDRIAGIGAIASGDMMLKGPVPHRPVPVIHFHGLQDRIAKFAGGSGLFAGTMHPPIPEVIAWWARTDGCGTEPAEVEKKPDYICTRYLPKNGATGAPVTFYVLPEGGHTWPGGVVQAPRLVGSLIKSVDASTLCWKFLSQYTLNGGQ
jgi:polyhydroxybutyrate depolymerase